MGTRRRADRRSEPARRLAHSGRRIAVRIEMISPDCPNRSPRRFTPRLAEDGSAEYPFHRGEGGGPRTGGANPAVQDAIGSIRDPGTLPQPLGERAALGPSVTGPVRLLSDFEP